MALQAALFSAPFPWVAAPALVTLALGAAEGFGWARWLRRSWLLMLAAALPAITGSPLGELAGAAARAMAGTAPGADCGAVLRLWEPSLLRSVRLALVLASAAWLSSGMSPVELRDALAALLRPLGSRVGGRAARAASLTMAFIPWTTAELRRTDEAARLRGSDPRLRPGRHLAAMSVPVVSRSLEKARRGAEALALRDPGFGG